jgi:hypothetical protein
MVEKRGLEMPALKTMVISLTTMAVGVLVYGTLKSSTRAAGKKSLPSSTPAQKKQADDELVDLMSQQSFPASDAPAY